MKWEGKKQTDDFEDRTGDSSKSGSEIDLTDIIGGLTNSKSSGSTNGGLGIGKSGGLVGIIIVVILGLLGIGGGTGGLGDILGSLTGQAPQTTQRVTTMGDSTDTRKAFSRTVFQMLEDYWSSEAKDYHITYNNPTLLIYSGSVQTPFGTATKDMGPFYSPSDEKIYLDTSFQDEVATSYGGSKGDYTMAYVLAHEFGHHIQNEIGLSQAMGRLQQQLSTAEYNKYSVCLELQADYLAGVWTKHLAETDDGGTPVLEKGDVDEALQTAAAIGDDTLQKKFNNGRVNPESFTHGTSADRQKYFELGYKYGDLEHSDVFADKGLKNPIGQMPAK
ncbi:KPN_02809 family neutral zinc metallopeptidase [Lactococcus insecticola]|uniref:Neutral zinc metallopeptidase n=1 Tax=Pseudolactococcus insecticola TaxID=2709158 RepID=A0A6A0B5P1_9LACT|nr:neutral zinc metallopeptidase [Lactococcus insecticola]GFH40552.1 hypothetical protein Hs20B_09500 [Lactococcus insecticola]